MVASEELWDVVVVGGGPAGLSAAHAAASAGARTLVLERSEHPRYKTCGGGLLGPSLAALPDGLTVPARDDVHRVTLTLHGRREYTRSSDRPLVRMVQRDEFDAALCRVAVAAGVTVRERATVRGLEQVDDRVRVGLADGSSVSAGVVVGADGSAGVTGRHVGVEFDQVDLGLEVDVIAPPAERERWRGRLLVDWGRLPGSYGWVFPKGDLLTVGVIAAKGRGDETKAYLTTFLGRLGLSTVERVHDTGHLTRCRSATSPLRRGRVLVVGDAAGLLEPWTREGISFALRSGRYAGIAAASGDLASYESTVEAELVPAMLAGRRLLRFFEAHPGFCHAALATAPGWRVFSRFCRGEGGLADVIDRRPVRAALRLFA